MCVCVCVHVCVCPRGGSYMRPLMALALCSSSGFLGWVGVCSGGVREAKLG